MVFFDVSKAYDTVPHVPLLKTQMSINIFSGGSKAISSTDPNTLQSKDMTLACYLWYPAFHRDQYSVPSSSFPTSKMWHQLSLLKLDDIALGLSHLGDILKFNARKCRQMLYRGKQHLTEDGTPLIVVTEYKYLCVIIASDLSWSSRITNICIKGGDWLEWFYTNSNS